MTERERLKALETCRLCDRERQLQDSHVVPKAFERLLRQGKHIYMTVLSEGRTKPEQRTIVEKLLCWDCEQKLQKEYETPSIRIIKEFEKHLVPMTKQPSGASFSPPYNADYMASGIQYASFKLFVLSVLWRMSVASRYPQLNLGPKHGSIIKEMIYSGEAAEPSQYPILTSLVYDGESRLQDVTSWSGNKSGHWCHNLMFGGAIFSIFTTSHRANLPSELPAAALKKDGTSFVHKTDFRRVPKVANFLSDVEQLWANRT